MKLPLTPPHLGEILSGLSNSGRFNEVLGQGISSAPRGRYYHWDKLRHLRSPKGLSSEEWWAAIKFARLQSQREIPLQSCDEHPHPFTYTMPDPVLAMLHFVDSNASGRIDLPEAISDPQTRERYLQRSLIEEAITSSLLEGAATTRAQAKQVIRSGRKPSDHSERMIWNNYQAMQLIGGFKDEPLSPDLVFRIHETITEETLPANLRAPWLRQPGDGIAVYDEQDTLLHRPPPAEEIEARMETMCRFANEEAVGDYFLHPVVKAIILHFWLAYDHPFIDGNGRTARALFYWAMLSQGYWLTEFISISSLLIKAPAQYRRAFLYTESDENDLTYFIDEQLRVIQRAIEELHSYLERKMKELHIADSLLRASVNLNHRQRALLSNALRDSNALYSIASHRMSHGVTYQTARADLLGLAKRGLLRKSRKRRTLLFTPAPGLADRLRKLT